MNFAWSPQRLLCLYDGETLKHTWTYSCFEKHLTEAITPSMYFWMTNYVRENYMGVPIEEEAIDAYFNLSILERIKIHAKMLKTLESEKKVLTEKLSLILSEIHEEEQWRGGYEEGAEHTTNVLYDHSDEM
jgi:hypothetical protein